MNAQSIEAFERLPERVKRCLLPSLLINTIPATNDSLSLGKSRIGGSPDLPADFQWPRYDGLSLSFVAQFDLAELAKQNSVLPLPSAGALAFFYDSEQRTWGFDPKDRGSSLVAYFPVPTTSLVPTPIPEDVPEHGRFSRRSVVWMADQNLPDPWSKYFEPELSDQEKTCYFEFLELSRERSTQPCHRLGGHADCVQNPMENECQLVTNGVYRGNAFGHDAAQVAAIERGSLDWRLLLQIDTDDDAGMMWGDCGRIYYWIKVADLRAANFANCWTILQCS